MTKPEWGIKRTCPHCGARFYDLSKNPAICPKCDTKVGTEKAAKPKRAPKPEEPAAAPVVAAKVKDEATADATADDLEGFEVSEDIEEPGEDEAIIENTDDLGEDDISNIGVTLKSGADESG